MAVEKEKTPATNIPQKAQTAARAETAPAPERRRRTYTSVFILVLLAVSFGVLAFFVKTIKTFPFDLVITEGIQSSNFAPFGSLMIAVSWLGFFPQSVYVTMLIIVVILFFGLQWEAMAAIIAAIASTGINVLVKDLIQRPRPSAPVIHVLSRLTDYSFPSGHVMFYVGFYGFIWFLAFTLLKSSLKRTLILMFLGSLIGLVGISRIYEGQHWFSDVLGAYLLGTLVLLGVIWVYRWGKARFFVHQPVAKPDAVDTAKG